jgi:hypothetical protein
MNGGQTDGRERFLKAIAERIAPERIEELHLFPAIRQGGREMGVAVVAVRLEEPVAEEPAAEQPVADEPVAEVDAPVDATDESASVDAPADAEEPTDPAPAAPDAVPDAPPPEGAPPRRFTVFRASYRLTLKGAERGKWEIGIVEEADAPASTVEEVVRGVHERAAVAEDGPERLTGDAFRALIAGAGEPWTASR